MSYTVQGINSVQQTVKPPPPRECGKEYLGLFPFTLLELELQTGFFVTWKSGAVDWFSLLGASFASLRSSFYS